MTAGSSCLALTEVTGETMNIQLAAEFPEGDQKMSPQSETESGAETGTSRMFVQLKEAVV